MLKNRHTLSHAGIAGCLTDGQLIERFLKQRDDAGEAAFRALVERHVPMVLRVCRDAVGDWHKAEDAPQATFNVLACKAGKWSSTPPRKPVLIPNARPFRPSLYFRRSSTGR